MLSATLWRKAPPFESIENKETAAAIEFGMGTARSIAAMARAAFVGASATGSHIGFQPKCRAKGSFFAPAGLMPQKSPVTSAFSCVPVGEATGQPLMIHVTLARDR